MIAPTSTAEPLWFLGNLARIHDPRLVEVLGACGDMPPLHVHHTEDELFYVLDGELSLFVGGTHLRIAAGCSALGPRGVPHVYRVESDSARWLAFAPAGDFPAFVAAAARPAERDELPPHVEPTPEQVAELNRLAADHGIEILAPPGTLPA